MKRVFVAVVLSLVAVAPRGASTAASKPTIEQFLMPGTPTEIVAAKKAERIAWTAYEHGLRNVYTAAAPGFAPVRLTNVVKDDGVELSDISVSDDGAVVVFVRGTQPNRDGWIANPTANPDGAQRTIWAVRTAGGAAWKLGEATTPSLSPDGRMVRFAKDGQIYGYAVGTESGGAGRSGGSKTPLMKAWGTNGTPVWSPDGSRFAFVSNRVDHSLVGVYDVRTRRVSFLAPSVDHDTGPTWSPDGSRVAFIRRPGTPFGRQAHQGAGGIGNPDGPADNGGPVRQMRLGYHFHHVAYVVNQWLASQGYAVISVNYRSGIGYGKSFRTAPNTGGRGNAEYQDVLAGGQYLQTRAEVDANRVGIWGLSYAARTTAGAPE